MKKKKVFILVFGLSVFLVACSIKYSAIGVDIPADAKTICIKQFQNNASLINLKLSNELTTQLKDKFQLNTRLSLVDARGDLYLEGEITNYALSSVALGADMATMNRLTISIRIKYENRFDEEKNIEQTFSRYMDFDSKQTLQQVEDVLVFQICEALVDDIFAATVGNW
ncbi:MAG: LPS assembly lipoprotein LptE [Bacteroidales bacterium]|jgi:hypothetical protein|nr:LPS assembly lipoprotein LptE [Bacteroidales bacterium]